MKSRSRKLPQAEVAFWRKELHRGFERALAETKLPERLDYESPPQQSAAGGSR